MWLSTTRHFILTSKLSWTRVKYRHSCCAAKPSTKTTSLCTRTSWNNWTRRLVWTCIELKRCLSFRKSWSLEWMLSIRDGVRLWGYPRLTQNTSPSTTLSARLKIWWSSLLENPWLRNNKRKRFVRIGQLLFKTSSRKHWRYIKTKTSLYPQW